ncbi:hypothetical protein PFICI_03978 [Pestalotiopsis fici W106-1]|uniref:T6SS Phospholipase effector Tle1-like catalytic domain-containing protein n=1 Tax=Pestalotiopsis fici (strain W106-1 / CGMCC3.15140) TaxID=1229662 RepID=W3XIQ6_PESFW|nr:uncharacterized protein PFICI_03978 [Pestalotiopsis fici W106-1]ETS85953.1 hypothetical protein PFICI_03978 [Pestalotiopsis fici W106-1]
MGSLGRDTSISTTPKRLIICCDGTWQSSVSNIKNVPSNVTRLARAFARVGRDADGRIWQQIVHYDAGIGTGQLSDKEKDRQGGFGIGFVENVIEAYTFIVLNYAPGDQIFCFGFSRGAYTARAVAGLVNDVGVISPRDLQDFPDLYKLYQENSDSHGFRKSDAYREWVHGRLHEDTDQMNCAQYGKHCHTDAPESSREVQVVGVFDTVGSLGVPDLAWTPFHLTFLDQWLGIPSAGFHNVSLSPYIRHAFHALALDEHRAPFSPTLWHFPRDGDLTTKKPKKPLDEIHKDWERVRSDPKSTPQQLSAQWAELIDCQMYDKLKGTDSELLQVWFPGFHINIGGGDDDPLHDRKCDFEQIALITFAWMCEQIAPYVQLDSNLLKLATNSVRDRYELIHAPLQLTPQTREEGLLKKASDLLNRAGAGQKPVSPEVQYGWADGPIVDSFAGTMKLAGSKPRTPGRYSHSGPDGAKLGKTNEMIHPSVQYRMQRRPEYRPEPLKGFTRQQTDHGFQWKQGEIVVPEYRIKSSDVFSRYIVDQDSLKGESQASKFVREIDQAIGQNFLARLVCANFKILSYTALALAKSASAV